MYLVLLNHGAREGSVCRINGRNGKLIRNLGEAPEGKTT
jgi:hypothetical protein